MIYLDCSGVHFGSQLDEKHLFAWATEIRVSSGGNKIPWSSGRT